MKAWIVIAGALLTLAGMFWFPWADISAVPVADFAGVGGPLDRALADLRGLLVDESRNTTIQLLLGTEELESLRTAVDDIVLDFNGVDAIRVFTGQQDLLDVTGMRAVVDSVAHVEINLLGLRFSGAQLKAELEGGLPDEPPSLLNYTIALIPILAALALLIGYRLLRQPRPILWLACIPIGLIGLVAMLHFYNTIPDILLPEGLEVSLIGRVLELPPVEEIIAPGFWLTIAGLAAVTLAPVFALPRNTG